MNVRTCYALGLRDGIPIALGYLSVAFAFGISAIAGGLDTWQAVMISMTNLTSAGQVAGLSVMLTSASLLEMAVTQFFINLRYALMSLSLSQKLDKSVTAAGRCLIAFFNTDEIFAVASSGGAVTTRYMLGLGTLPYLGWTGGTLLGAVAGRLLPESLTNALGIAIYGMFIALIVPACRRERPVLAVAGAAVALSVLFHYGIPAVSPGIAIVICAAVASVLGALLFPIREELP